MMMVMLICVVVIIVWILSCCHNDNILSRVSLFFCFNSKYTLIYHSTIYRQIFFCFSPTKSLESTEMEHEPDGKIIAMNIYFSTITFFTFATVFARRKLSTTLTSRRADNEWVKCSSDRNLKRSWQQKSSTLLSLYLKAKTNTVAARTHNSFILRKVLCAYTFRGTRPKTMHRMQFTKLISFPFSSTCLRS